MEKWESVTLSVNEDASQHILSDAIVYDSAIGDCFMQSGGCARLFAASRGG